MRSTKLSNAQCRTMKWLGHGWHGIPGAGSAVMVNGERICNVDTMSTLKRLGLVELIEEQGARHWQATESGRNLTTSLCL